MQFLVHEMIWIGYNVRLLLKCFFESKSPVRIQGKLRIVLNRHDDVPKGRLILKAFDAPLLESSKEQERLKLLR